MWCRPVSASASISADLVGGADRAGFDLKALARAFLVDFDVLRQVGHGAVSPRCGCGGSIGAAVPQGERGVKEPPFIVAGPYGLSTSWPDPRVKRPSACLFRPSIAAPCCGDGRIKSGDDGWPGRRVKLHAQCEICSSSRLLVRGPKMPIDSTTISMAKAIRPNTPVVPSKCAKQNPMMKLANTVLMRLNA